MSNYKHEFKAGEKAYYKDKTNSTRRCLIVSGGVSGQCSYFLRYKNSKVWIKHSDGNRIVFQEEGINLMPRGKKAKARYLKAKSEWKALREFKVGDWVFYLGGIVDFDGDQISEITNISEIYGIDWIQFNDDSNHNYASSSFRRATPEEIAEAQKPKSVWDLKYEDECFYLDSGGYICASEWSHKWRAERDRGLIFLSKEDAKSADEKRIKENQKPF